MNSLFERLRRGAGQIRRAAGQRIGRAAGELRSGGRPLGQRIMRAGRAITRGPSENLD